MRRLALLLVILAAPLRAQVASSERRADALRALELARGRYEQTPEELRWERITLSGKPLVRARVRSADTWTATVYFDRGIITVPLARLPEPARALLGFDPNRPPAAPSAPSQVTAAPSEAADDPVSRVLAAYGERPVVRREVNLRPEFERFGLDARDQGGSPSCSAFAVVCALEFQLAKAGRPATRLGEDFLVWATLRSIGLTKDRIDRFGGEARLADGFTLVEVAQALRSHGVPPHAIMPVGFDPRTDMPPWKALEEARKLRRVGAVELTGRTPKSRLEQLVLALNEGIPVAVGLRWPVETPALRATGRLPDAPEPTHRGHAVVITGYSCPDGIPEHTVFRFKNSYGPEWGERGYGSVSWDYLLRHGHGGLFLDLR